MATTFEERLRELLNQESMENQSGTPDYILAHYLSRCLDAFDQAVQSRDGWYSRNPQGAPREA